MSLHNFLPPNREFVGYKVFPLPDKSIRLDDPNYIHYVPTEPIFGDRFDTALKDDDSYNAPGIDERTILRTHVPVSSYRRSYSGSIPSYSPQKTTPSPSRDRDVIASFQTPSSKGTSPRRSLQDQFSQNSFYQAPIVASSPIAPETKPEPEPEPEPPLTASVIRPESSNLLEHFHTFNSTSVDDYATIESSPSIPKEEAEKKSVDGEEATLNTSKDVEGAKPSVDGEDHVYAVIQPRDQRLHHRIGENGEERATFGENEYDVAVGPLTNTAVVVAGEQGDTTTYTSTLTFTSTVTNEEQQAIQAEPEPKRNSFSSACFDELQQELKQVTSTRGAAIQLKEEAVSKKEQEVEYERQKAKMDFTPEKFLHEIPGTDIHGAELTDSQRLDLAQQLADKLRAEREAELEAEFEEWKRVNDIETPCTVRRGSSSPSNK